MKKFLILILVIIFISIPVNCLAISTVTENILDLDIFDIKSVFVPKLSASSQIRDVVYKTTPEEKLKLDIYYPGPEEKCNYPLIIYIHGGGFIRGDKGEIRELTPLLNFFLKKSWAVASINYRLIDHDTMFPDNIKDVKDAIYWLQKNAGKYHLNTDKIGLIGLSSGGCLALLAGLTDRDQFSSNSSLPLFHYSSRFKFIISMAGPTNLYKDEVFKLRKEIVSLITKKKLDEKLLQQASPIYYLDKDNKNIPLLLIHGENDGFVPWQQSEAFNKKAHELGINSKLVIIKKCGHTIPFSYLPRVELVKKEIDDFLQNIN